jgi:phosphatidylserine/phosphatidylglycerophosphate/cardiolipin synthase-like enzyme
MHNKFIVFDANSTNPEKPWVWTGSTNLTDDQINLDANNMVFIQDQSLAKTYQIEFEEMWGSTSLVPNNNNSKFGADKKDNTPHEFLIGGKKIQCFFSPSDGTNQQIINAINSADNDLEVESMLITRTDLANTIVAAKQRGVEVEVITDNRNDNTQTINDILDAALPEGKLVFDIWEPGMLHHKLAIIDANFSSSDPLVITGSHNWSYSADNINDENTLIIHDAEISNLYFQQFAARFTENKGTLYVRSEKIEWNEVRVYPNPSSDKITISSSSSIKSVQLYSVSGNLIQEFESNNSMQMELQIKNEKPGIYILKLEFEKGKINSYKIVKN